ncbi:outer membrane protein assembly factor BamB family protein [Actinotalea solisilvae]|uniref:outer membrane protein assembly factor BamB family protein n=1 Tax=Actinotalea solisilvae TaxID=2072922 RepID=UPI0018F10F14|nr:PQQ-binding-like beta-propeller repeat protein [Actinotalea solisilvae]
MTSPPRHGASVEVELDEVADPGAAGAGRPGRPRRTARAAGARLGPRAWGPSARAGTLGSAVLAVGVVVALVAWLVPPRATPGPLVGTAPALASPLTEVWRVEARSGWWAAHGQLLVPGRTAAGPEVVARDLTTGDVVWRLSADDRVPTLACPVGVTAASGPAVVCQAFGPLGPTDPPGHGVAQHPGALLVVAAADGAVLDRVPLEPDHLGFGAVDGDLVLARRTAGGVEVERRTPDGPREWRTSVALPGGDVPGPAARVEMGDRAVLVSGTATVLLDGADGSRLGTWGAVPQATAAAPRLTSRGTATGVRVERAAGARGPVTSWFGPDGTLLGRFAGASAEPAVTDSSPPDVALADADGALRGVDLTGGDVVWSLPGDGAVPVLRSGGAVLVVRPTALAAVALATGTERWSVPLTGTDVVHAVSDGDVVLATGMPPGRGPSLSALSLEDGSLRWRTALPPGTSRVEVADGRVVAVGGATVVGLG